MIKQVCPLCNSNNSNQFSKDKKREYYQCSECKTIYVPTQFHLSIKEEKKRYDLHTNSINDKFYINFLKRIITPLVSNVKPYSKGLDFGCGPGPILKKQLEAYNLELKEYDPYYNNDKSLLQQNWDFIISTEVIEHLKEPIKDIELLWSLLNKGGVLAIMTNLYESSIVFSSWYYKGDPTHITFFSKKSFEWLSNKLDADIQFFDKDITIFIKR